VRIAIIGSGISALVAARELQARHEIVVYEKEPRLGGHSHTVVVEDGERTLGIDTGFIVYNERTYPIFSALLRELGVATQPGEMSFGVRCDRCRLEWAGSGFAGIFAQRRRLASPGHWRMLVDVLRFNRDATRAVDETGLGERPLRDFLAAGGYSRGFLRHYLLPMGGAIWSAPPGRFDAFPAGSFLRFFHNHGLLTVAGQPIWRTVVGGSREYVRALVRPFADRVRLRSPVWRIRRTPLGIEVATDEAPPELFDRVVVGTHADQALALLADPSEEERRALECLPYQPNLAVLHTDESVLPVRHAARASWNVRIRDCERLDEPLVMTYSMNRLQRLDARRHYCVTLNDEREIAPDRILERIPYEHPKMTVRTLEGQRRLGAVNGARGTHFCGAYAGYGFHEDGARSGLEVARAIDEAAKVAA
jgi:uncharacterized protein